MGHIDFEAKTDRELLILVAQKCNETTDHLAAINNKLLWHEDRIKTLESCISGCSEKKTWKETLRNNWQTLSLLASVLALIIVEVAQRLTF